MLFERIAFWRQRVDTSAIIKAVRARTGLSQRATAEAAGTSGPTVADYEAGRKEPRLSTLSRIAAAAGLEVELRFAPSPHERALDRQRRRRRAMAAATALRVRERWDEARPLAIEQLDGLAAKARGRSGEQWVATWRRAVDDGPEAVVHLLLRDDPAGDDLRQVAPFAGLWTDDERRLVLAAAAAAHP
jgi:transcriptional regulator with XRE-family HTH domain